MDACPITHHNLQEPARKVSLFANLVLEEAAGKLSEAAIQKLKSATEASQCMSRALRDVLTCVSLEETNEFSAVNLQKTLKELMIEMEGTIKLKGAEILIDPMPIVSGSAGDLKRLFFNLLDNSFKFSKEGERPVITITCQPTVDTFTVEQHPELNPKFDFVHIIIKDNGIGFSNEYKEKIFSLFHRLHPEDHYEGFGVGLAFCRKVVQKHGGTIWAEGSEGDGASIHVLLPNKVRV